MWDKIAPYGKTITALFIGLVGWLTLIITSEPAAITAQEWLAGLTALGIALGVYQVPNRTE